MINYDTYMSHSSHYKFPVTGIANSLLVVISFVAALILHLGNPLGNPAGNPALISQGQLSTDAAGRPWAVVEGFQIVGIERRVSLTENGGMTADVENLWQAFQVDPIHARLDWSEPQTAFAYYNEIDQTRQTAVLIIGYSSTQLKDIQGYSVRSIKPGSYWHHALEGISDKEFFEVWQGILSEKENVRAILERYGLDSWGNTRAIQVQALLKQV